jgi:hypothetical protein
MNLKKVAAQAAIAAVLGFPALGLGVGVGTASAEPGPPCGNYCDGQQNQRGDDGDGGFRGDGGFGGGGQFDQQRWDQRGIDDGRFDHQPFNYQGQRVEPYFDNGQGAWGFQFLGIFVPL